MKMSATDWLLLIMVILGVMLSILSNRAKQNVERITTTDTVYITDSISNWYHDTVYISRWDTIKLPIVHTDTIIKLDSILVQVPISVYHYDTTITDSTHTTAIQADIEGIAVRLEQLTIDTKITPQKPKITPKNWYQHLCPAVGIGIGTGGAGLFVGVGYEL